MGVGHENPGKRCKDSEEDRIDEPVRKRQRRQTQTLGGAELPDASKRWYERSLLFVSSHGRDSKGKAHGPELVDDEDSIHGAGVLGIGGDTNGEHDLQ